MASIINQPGGLRTVQFKGLDGKRRSIRLGKTSKAIAATVAGHVQGIIDAADAGVATDPQTIAWLSSIGDDLYAKLANAGLVHPRAGTDDQPKRLTLGDFLNGILDRRKDITPATRINYQAAMKSLREFFGDEKPLDDLTQGDAEDFRRWLLTDKEFSRATAG